MYEGKEADRIVLESFARSELLTPDRTPLATLTMRNNESLDSFQRRRDDLYSNTGTSAVQQVVNQLHAQWPCEVPVKPRLTGPPDLDAYIDLDAVISAVKPKFKAWFDNKRFFEYLQEIEGVMKRLSVVAAVIPKWTPRAPAVTVSSVRRYISDDDLFNAAAPALPDCGVEDTLAIVLSTSEHGDGADRLSELVKTLERSGMASQFERDYVQDLRASLISLHGREKHLALTSSVSELKQALLAHKAQCYKLLMEIYEGISSAVTAPYPYHVEQFPRISPLFFLQQLSRDRRGNLSDVWRVCLVRYATTFARHLRAKRLVRILNSGSTDDLINELRNVPHTNWNTAEHLDALLLEVESDLTIRHVQEEIAREMRSGQGPNRCMQLHMGQGKSSVIVPNVAAALADGMKLVRVVVAKAQSKQMAQMLISKLGGLLNRRVYYMPFSRSLKLDAAAAATVSRICRECMAAGGVLLVQPEHILSFKLMGLDAYISGREDVGKSLLMAQDFFEADARDVVDESDDIFSVKFEVVYTVGVQRPMDMGRGRWTCVQQVLDLMRRNAPSVKKDLPTSLELIEREPGNQTPFPRSKRAGFSSRSNRRRSLPVWY